MLLLESVLAMKSKVTVVPKDARGMGAAGPIAQDGGNCIRLLTFIICTVGGLPQPNPCR